MEFHQFGKIKSWPFQNLNLSDVNVVQRINSLAGFLYIHGHGIRDQFVNDFFKIDGRYLSGDDINHFFADLTNLEMQKKKIFSFQI